LIAIAQGLCDLAKDRRDAVHARQLAHRRRIVKRQILALTLFRRWRATKTRIKLRDEDRVRPQRLDLLGERAIETLYHRDKEAQRDDADGHTKDRQRRTQLVRPDR